MVVEDEPDKSGVDTDGVLSGAAAGVSEFTSVVGVDEPREGKEQLHTKAAMENARDKGIAVWFLVLRQNAMRPPVGMSSAESDQINFRLYYTRGPTGIKPGDVWISPGWKPAGIAGGFVVIHGHQAGPNCRWRRPFVPSSVLAPYLSPDSSRRLIVSFRRAAS